MEAAAAAFRRDGIAVVPSFAAAPEIAGMRAAFDRIIAAWDPADSTAFTNQPSTSRFLFESADAVSVFTEPADPRAVNKVGHGLHHRVPEFRDYAHSPKVAALVRALGYARPVLPQSMYICKQDRVGGEVTAHQDSTFLATEPRESCLGLWLALEDATLQNGCLWARPGSHAEPVRRRFVRRGDAMAFEQTAPALPWDGGMPEGGPAAAGFEPYPVAAGDLVLIHGAVDHLSLANTSGHSRHTFQLHLVEGPAAGVTWADSNWLQLPGPFPEL